MPAAELTRVHSSGPSGHLLPEGEGRDAGVRASVGFYSDKGPRKENEDFAAAVIGAELPEPRREVVAAIADGVGGAKGGRVAAELAVRGFLDGFWDLPETMEVRRAGARVITALNAWINTLGRQDAELKGMACTFTALVLRGRVAHLLHIGDTRAYRLRRDRLSCLTEDHSRDGGGGQRGDRRRSGVGRKWSPLSHRPNPKPRRARARKR